LEGALKKAHEELIETQEEVNRLSDTAHEGEALQYRCRTFRTWCLSRSGVQIC
jgi:hypothetical protein